MPSTMSLVSALVTSLALAVLALPTGSKSTELTSDNFKSSVSTGLWLIEHFSPYCGHCTAFAPTWEKLAKEAHTNIPNVRLAQVNCVLHGDLCDANHVQVYPTLQMFEDGKMVEQFKGDREFERVKAFISKYAEKKQVKAPEAPVPPLPPTSKQSASPQPVLNPTGEVIVLNSATFEQTLEQGPTFVKFYAPWCGHCKKLAPIWKQLARHMQHTAQIAQVNCDEEGAICQSKGVKGYPTLMYFSNGAQSEYNGGRKLDQLKAFVAKASAEGIVALEKEGDLEEHVRAEPVVYLLIHSSSDTDLIQRIRSAAAPLLGSPVVYTTTSQSLRTKYNVPQGIPWALIALKDNDASTVTSALYGGPTSTPEHVKNWLLTHHLPGAVELQQDTFQTVMNAKHSPLVLIASSNEILNNKVEERVRDIAKKWRVRTGGSGVVNNREVVFTWMNAQRWKEWMTSMYGIKMGENEGNLEDVKVVVADHQRLIYWTEDRLGSGLKLSSTSTLFAAIEDIATGKVPFKNSENMIERFARYLNTKMTGLEEYVSEYPLRFVSWIVFGLLIVFFIVHRLIGDDASKAERGEYARVGRSSRLD